MAWRHEYDNDVGPDDDGFWEWYTLLKDDKPIGRIYDKDDAELIVLALNRWEESMDE